MYGVGSAGDLWRDDDGDSIPEFLVGTFNVPDVFGIGLAFDSDGALFVQDIVTDTIYRSTTGVGGLVAHEVLPFDSNFSQGLYAFNGVGYQAAFNDDEFLPQHYTFDTAQPGNFTLQSQALSSTDIQIGDLTLVVPEPSAMLVLTIGGIAAVTRRRRA